MIKPVQEIKNLLGEFPEFEHEVFDFACGGESAQDVLAWLKNRIAEKLSREFLDANV